MMAQKTVEPRATIPVLLGFIDEEITSKYATSVNNRTSKIGGLPDWPIDGCQSPICQCCKNIQVLIAQIYAPLHICSDHRTLYIFACLTPTCWGSLHSWTCIRVHAPASPTPEVSAKKNIPTSLRDTNQGSGLFEVADDWGSDSDDVDNNDDDNANTAFKNATIDNGTGITCTNLNRLLNPNDTDVSMSPPPTTSSAGFLDELANRATVSSTNLNLRNANTVQTDRMDTVTIGVNTLNLNQGVRQLVAGAMGEAGGGNGVVAAGEGGEEEASALIEGAEGDMVAVDSPDLPTRDILQWFKPHSQVSPSWQRPDSLRPLFLCCDEEAPLSKSEIADRAAHEEEALRRYRAQPCKDDDGMESGDGRYVKSVPVHGDVYIQKFKKKIAHAPDQVLRYCRESASGPLLLRPLVGLESGAKCRYCHAPLVFELQIMPQLIPYLQPRYNSDVTNQEGNTTTPLTNINNDNRSNVVSHDQAKGEVGSNVNVGSPPRQCRSTRSKYAGSRVKSNSGANFTESMESIDSKERGDSAIVPASPKMKSKRNKNQLGGHDERCEDSAPVFSGRSMLSGVVEYGTVLLFTCSQSCWQGAPQTETVLVQPEVL